MSADSVAQLRALYLQAAADLAHAIPDVQQGSYSGYHTDRIQAEAVAVAMLRFAAVSLLPPDDPPPPTPGPASHRRRDAHGRFQSRD